MPGVEKFAPGFIADGNDRSIDGINEKSANQPTELVDVIIGSMGTPFGTVRSLPAVLGAHKFAHFFNDLRMSGGDVVFFAFIPGKIIEFDRAVLAMP
jgi:hypothetical protein